ncbi:MAG: methylase [Parcubacteria group bacterium Gr01-1014_48]|nr:MAG: methylase [Parcubacteria group bacterium Greene0416_14]TSC73475.1 MAG: methylase [Parcubacteria group bacterium Gr01-1014_48]TSD00558.1 MAG: methylase [Parcubacteria group bacterium Greene1014_15]TSD08251.1 MAG: methylase [Parcubacteria group bacterium Greene0714_4]
MTQRKAWEDEYKKPKLVTLSQEPHNDVRKFWKFLKKEYPFPVEKLQVLDLGSGTGKHAFYFAELGAQVTGIEISETALKIAEKIKTAKKLPVQFLQGDIGKKYPFGNAAFDIVLDILSSNSLDEAGRANYLRETARILKPEGFLMVKILCKDGDKNAHALLASNPGKEKDTYTIHEINLTERVFSREDFEKMYGKYFTIRKLEKNSSYTLFNNQRYKRNFWIAYCQKNR